MDTPDGTGDHENYFVRTTHAYELDGTRYENCIKKAVNIRSKIEQKTWTAIDKYNFLYSNGFKYYNMIKPIFQNQIPVLRPDYS